jgi:pimeloyl-ACP methyl ester carboxylesterase
VQSDPAHFEVVSDGCRLAARSYAPDSSGYDGGVLLIHGLLSSADIFDLPGTPAASLARHLQSQGIHTVSYDQRGAGGSTTTGWRFGLGEHALVDLPAVVAACASRFGWRRIVLAGHSLGGLIWLRFLRSLPYSRESNGVTVVGGVAIASPAVFDSRLPPWCDLARRGRRFIERIDHDENDIVSREEFTSAQILLYWPWARPLAHPRLLRFLMKHGARRRWVAQALRTSPAPTLVFHRDDFDTTTFMRVLGSRVLDRGSHALLLELFELIGGQLETGPPITGIVPLCVGSGWDRLIPLGTVAGFARQFAEARTVVVEDEVSVPCGHVGYFFKPKVHQHVQAEAAAYALACLGR